MRIITNDNMTAKDRLSFLRQMNWRIRKLREGLEKMAKAFSEVGVKAQKELVEAYKKIKLKEK